MFPHAPPRCPCFRRDLLAAALLSVLLAGCGGGDGPLFAALPRGDLPAGGKTYGGTLLDADGDGHLDLLFSVHGNAAELQFLRPGPLFRRELLPEALPEVPDHHGAAACDHDGDGHWEVLVTTGAEHGAGAGRNQLWDLAGPRRFRDVGGDQPALADPLGRGRGALWGDFDRDRRPELLLLNYASPARLLAHGEDGSWRDVTPRLPIPAPVVPWRPGTPVPERDVRRRSFAVHGAVAGDFDDDGDTDLVVLGRAGQCGLWINDGRGRFWDGTARSGLKTTFFPEPAKHAAAGDVDGDGDLDLVILHRRNPEIERRRAPVEVWLGDPSRGYPFFVRASSPAPQDCPDPLAALLADLDNDGRLDLYVVHTADTTGVRPPNRLYQGDGTGGFLPPVRPWGGAGPLGGNPDSAWPVDLDRDGDLDLITFNGEKNHDAQRGGVLCYENRSPAGTGLTVELVATEGTPHGLGARVELHAGGRAWLRRVRSVAAPHSSAILPVHFGIGDLAGPFTVVVRWPSGQLQNARLDAAGAAYRLVEGRAEAVRLPVLEEGS